VKGTTADNISTGTLKETRIMMPPIELQERFCVLARRIFKIIERQETSSQELHTLFVALMQKAFRGELSLN
jgi:type I restriction enzyme S subunit